MAEFVTGQLVFSKQDNAEVTIDIVYASTNEARVIRDSYGEPTKSWRDLSTLTPLEPKVGDRVRCVAIAPINSNPAEFSVGEEFTVGRLGAANCYFRSGEVRFGGWIEAVLLSRASPPAEVKERKFYGSQPSELPKTLPAGTKGTSGTVLLAEATLRGGSYCFDSWRNSAGHETRGTPSSWGPHHVNWSTVEIQPAPTSAGEAVAAGWEVGRAYEWIRYNETLRGTLVYTSVDEKGTQCLYFNRDDGVTGIGDNRTWLVVVKECSRIVPISPPPAGSADAAIREDAAGAREAPGETSAQPVGGGSLKPDPYARITVAGTESDRLFAIEENIRAHRMQSEDATLDRLAATRRAKLAQTKQAMDRPAVERHPAPSSMASSRGVVFGPLGEKQFHRSARRHWKRDEGHPVTWPSQEGEDP